MLYLLLDKTRAWLDSVGLYRVFMVLDQLEFRALAAALLAFGLVVFCGRPVIAWLRRQKIGDAGLTDAEALRRHTASKANTPTMGGVLIVGAILGAVGLLADIGDFYIVLALVVLAWLAVLGGWDDWLKLTAASRAASGGAGRGAGRRAGGGMASRQGLYAWEKLVFQIGLGVLVGYFAYNHGDSSLEHDLAHVLNLPFQRTYEPGEGVAPGLFYLPRAAFIVFAILVLAGMSNAVNITDGMDGLAAGITCIVSLGLVVLTFIAGREAVAQYLLVPSITGSSELVVLAAATAGACLGFLWWNCAPAQVFMGDTGSLALGGVLGYIAVVVRQEALLLLMCGVFLLEIGSVVLQVGYFKATKGKRIFKCAPFHHHLHLSGWTEGQVVTRFWIVSAILVGLALALLKVR